MCCEQHCYVRPCWNVLLGCAIAGSKFVLGLCFCIQIITQNGVSGIATCLDAIDHRHGHASCLCCDCVVGMFIKPASIEGLSPQTFFFAELCMQELIMFEAMLI